MGPGCPGTWRTQATAAWCLPPQLGEEEKKKKRRERKSEKSFCNILTAAFDSEKAIGTKLLLRPCVVGGTAPRTQERWRGREVGWGTSPPGKDWILGVEAPKAPQTSSGAKEIPEGLVDPFSGPHILPGCFLGEEQPRQVLWHLCLDEDPKEAFASKIYPSRCAQATRG